MKLITTIDWFENELTGDDKTRIIKEPFTLHELCRAIKQCKKTHCQARIVPSIKRFRMSLRNIFALLETIDYFKDRGSSVIVGALGISNALDTVNHYKLYASLINSWIHRWNINVIINWCSKFSVAVRWKAALFNIFFVHIGLRQGSSLSRALFNLFVNMFIIEMRELNVGCCVSGTFVDCIMYAADFFVLAASVCGLQSLPDCCHQVSITLIFKYNYLKSSRSVVDPACKLNISKIQLWTASIDGPHHSNT